MEAIRVHNQLLMINILAGEWKLTGDFFMLSITGI